MKNIVLCGFMGCGKSTVGKRLAARCGMRFVDMDAYIEEQAGCSVTDIFAQKGEAAFRVMEHDACVTLAAQEGLVIATGGGAVLFEKNVDALAQNGVIVFLRVREQTVLERLTNDTTRPLLQRDDKEAAVRALMQQRTPLYEAAAHVTVDADGEADAVVTAIEAALSRT